MPREFNDDFTSRDALRGIFRLREGQEVLKGRYELIRELGRGGMGVVWLAKDKILSDPVALKLVALKFLPELILLHEGELTKLRQEVNIGMTLRHPALVRTHHLEVDGSLAAVIMEYVEGETLRQKLEGNPRGFFEPHEIAGWILDIAKAIDYLHRLEKPLVHRDLKPANIIINDRGEALLLDFGISHPIAETMTRCTAAGAARPDNSRTLVYASPEQIDGSLPHPADDVYSLGVVMYELLAGNPPFFRGREEIVSHAIHLKPVPSIRKRRSENVAEGHAADTGLPVPRCWEKLIFRMLEKKREDRPVDIVAALRKVVRATPAPPAAGPAPAVHGALRTRRRKILTTLTALAIAGAAAGLIAWLSPEKKLPDNPPNPPLPAPPGKDATMATIAPAMPAALFDGIPHPISNPPPNLEKVPVLRREMQVPAGVRLLSRQKPVSSSDPSPIGDLSLITDGSKEGDSGYVATLLPGPQWVQIDLGESRAVHLIWVWHFHKANGVTCRDVIVRISDDKEFRSGTTVFNNDHDNSSGLGTGRDPAWLETSLGRPLPVTGVKGRYVRIWSNGSNIDDDNHCIEVEVYGK